MVEAPIPHYDWRHCGTKPSTSRVRRNVESSKVQLRRRGSVHFRLRRVERLFFLAAQTFHPDPLWACFGPHVGGFFGFCGVCFRMVCCSFLVDHLQNSATMQTVHPLGTLFFSCTVVVQ